jgi:NAD(P)H-dependent flavin oxidoreductase YrpB (nitropropane dioxygenase family)
VSGTAQPMPVVIQGGMGVAVSGWRLARAVSLTGQLGVVSGTALDVVCARRLQCGDPGGHVRRALARFPVPAVAERILAAYFVAGGKASHKAFRPTPRFTVSPARALQELTVAGSFVEVFLAKEGHGGPVGINFLRKIELPLPFACYGALLAGVDHVLVGAGSPAELPALLDRLSRHEPVELPVRVQGATSADGQFTVKLDPRALLGPDLPPLRRPRFDAIVASVELAQALTTDPVTCPDGFVVEGHTAGGHNAPPRGPRRLNERGEPLYDARDEVAADALAGLGRPYWMAGGYGSPEALASALAAGADGVQAGTVFALCEESGMAPGCRQRLLELARAGDVRVCTDGRASPTGFPFKVADVPGTLSDDEVYRDRQRLCDLAVLRSPYRRADGSLGYRCPAEPVPSYVERRGGRAANTDGRRCLCNGLFAAAGLPQRRPGGYVEPAIVTAGMDFTGVRRLLATVPLGQTYTAAEAVAFLLGH